MRAARPASIDWVLSGVAVCAVATACALCWVYLPLFGAARLSRLQYFGGRLPFAVALVAEHRIVAAAALATLVLVVVAGGLRALLRQPGWGRALLGVAAASALLVTGVCAVGLRTASAIDLFAAAPGLARCPCPAAFVARPLECHCDPSGRLQEVFWPRADLDGTPVGARLLEAERGATDRADTVRETLLYDAQGRALGRVVSAATSPAREIRCYYATPCARGQSCGTCTFVEAATSPTPPAP